MNDVPKEIRVVVESTAVGYHKTNPFMDVKDLEQIGYVTWWETILEKPGAFDGPTGLAYLKKIISNRFKDAIRDELKHQEHRVSLDKVGAAAIRRSKRMMDAYGEDE